MCINKIIISLYNIADIRNNNIRHLFIPPPTIGSILKKLTGDFPSRTGLATIFIVDQEKHRFNFPSSGIRCLGVQKSLDFILTASLTHEILGDLTYHLFNLNFLFYDIS